MSGNNSDNSTQLRTHQVSQGKSRGRTYPRLSFQRSRILQNLGWEPGDNLIVIVDRDDNSIKFIPEDEYDG